MASDAWKAWAVPAKTAPDAPRHSHLPRGSLDRLHRIAECHPGRQIERYGHRRELPLVIHRQCRRLGS